MNIRSRIITPLVFLLVAACSPAESARNPEHVQQVDTLGDTIVVRTVTGSVWGEEAELNEDLRIGAIEGREEEAFGSVRLLAADENGGILVFDSQVPALRHFDSLGTFLRTVGREGEGPGEYHAQVQGLAVRRDGRIVLWDPRNARVNLYERDGTPLDEWTFVTHHLTRNGMVLDTADHVYLETLNGPLMPNEPPPLALTHLDAQGRLIEMITAPAIANEPQWAAGNLLPKKVWKWSPLGYPVVGVNDEYAIELRRPAGPMVRIERPIPAVSLHPKERAEYQARRRWTLENESRFLATLPSPVPATKPYYRDIHLGSDGSIWVERFSEARKKPGNPAERSRDGRPLITWVEPTIYDVFTPDGTYLGEVRQPERTEFLLFSMDTVWGVTYGNYYETYVVKYSITP